MRIVLGVVAGLATAFVCVFAIEFVSHMIFPPPPGTDLTNPADMERLMQIISPTALALVAAAWFVGALLGAAVANALARRSLAGWIVALLMICGAVLTMIDIPHPIWMWAAGILLPPIAGWLAQRLTKVPA